MRLIYHPDAEAELIDAAQFYERRVPDLGLQFVNDVDIAIGIIKQAPERWRVLEADVRRCLMRRFPYALYYRLDAKEIRILAVAHHSRHPDYWHHRISS